MIRRLTVPLITLALAVPLRAQEADGAVPPPRPPKSSSTLITAGNIEEVRPAVANAYDAVKLLRPRWLRRDVLRLPGRSGGMQMQQIHIFMDDRDVGDLDYLRSIPAEQIFTLRFMSLAEVGARYGPASGPGIVVTLKR